MNVLVFALTEREKGATLEKQLEKNSNGKKTVFV